MANPGLPRKKHRQILDLAAKGLTMREVSRKLNVGIGTVSKYSSMPLPPEVDPVEKFRRDSEERAKREEHVQAVR